MLERALAGVRSFHRQHTEGHVAVYANPPPSRLIHDREVGLAGEIRVDLDEVRAMIGQCVYHGSSLGLRAHDDRVARQRRIAVD